MCMSSSHLSFLSIRSTREETTTFRNFLDLYLTWFDRCKINGMRMDAVLFFFLHIIFILIKPMYNNSIYLTWFDRYKINGMRMDALLFFFLIHIIFILIKPMYNNGTQILKY